MSKWKHGLKLVKCAACIDEQRIPYGCKLCEDMGEYWIAPTPGGASKQRVIVGTLIERIERKSKNWSFASRELSAVYEVALDKSQEVV